MPFFTADKNICLDINLVLHSSLPLLACHPSSFFLPPHPPSLSLSLRPCCFSLCFFLLAITSHTRIYTSHAPRLFLQALPKAALACLIGITGSAHSQRPYWHPIAHHGRIIHQPSRSIAGSCVHHIHHPTEGATKTHTGSKLTSGAFQIEVMRWGWGGVSEG